MKKAVTAAVTWLQGERKRLGWSAADLTINAVRIAGDLGWEGDIPTVSEIEELESGQLKQLPRWFKLLRYASEFASVPSGHQLAWIAERNYFYQADRDLRFSRPLLFEDEHRFINSLDRLREDHRRALRTFVTNFAGRQCYEPKEEFARRFLARLGITVPVLAENENEVVELFQAMKPEQQALILDMLRNLVTAES
jgi:hypothetical protein